MKQVHALNYIEMLCASLESYAMVVCCTLNCYHSDVIEHAAPYDAVMV